MKSIHKIKPREGLVLRFPGMKRFLKPEGEFIEWSSFWQRRLDQGDVKIVSTLQEEKDYLDELKGESKVEEKTNLEGVEDEHSI